MSVLPRHGGSYLQRRLTKMYTDTKTSCESVTTASNALDSPELSSIHRNFKTQRDRLLAWGLDWSDASAAQPNDIDESLTQAGFSDVVESVMSSIQDLLSEAEGLQNKGASDLPSKGGKTDSPAGDALGGLPSKTTWTNAEISRSKTLLSELTACIDVLYDLSRSRRDMNASSTSGKSRTQSYPSPHAGTPGGDSGYSKLSDSKSYHAASFDSSMYQSSPSSKSKEAYDYSSYTNLHAVTESPVLEQPTFAKKFSKDSVASRSFLIDRSALQLTGASHDNNPPPYEMVAASTNSRVLGRMKTSALPFPHNIRDPTVSILVEYTPMVLDSSSDVSYPKDSRLDNVHQALEQLVQNARVSHLGLLRFLGYYIDRPNSRYAFVYQMPVDYFPYLQNPTDLLNGLKPKPLVSLLQSGEDYPQPNLETRFRLAYDLLMAVLQLRSQNLVHGNINSSNVLILPGLTSSNQNEIGLTENLRRPYLTSFAQFSGNNPSPEPLSAGMYRHPDDKRSIDDDAAWAYDLYSLGLVLMEIGLWTPVSRLWKMKYNTSIFKQRVESQYLQKLGPKCGTAFCHMVQLCLDAPNFHLSTQPFDDFNLRIPQTFHYPVLDLSAPDSTFSFSMNFIYTLCKITWSCCKIDIFNAPGAEELDDCLPLALVPGSEADAAKQAARNYTAPEQVTQFVPPVNVAPAPEMKMMKLGIEERKMKKRTFKKLTTVEIPQEHLNEWNFQMLPRLRKLLQKILKDSSESCGVTLMMTGDGLDNAKTTICVTCSSVKKVRAALKKYFPLEREDWDLIVLRGDIERSKVPRKKRRRPAKTGPQSTIEAPPSMQDSNPCYQQHPLCGASIGAFMNDEHLPPVSYGGAILVDGVPYGMTVHHMLEAPSDQEDDYQDEDENDAPTRSAANWPRDMISQEPQPMYTWCDEDPSGRDLEFEISDDEDGDDYYDEFGLSDGYSSDEDDDEFAYDDEDAASIGDTAGIEPGEEPPLFVTQPAIDDVREDFFPSPEDRDDEHLASHAFGYVHASSGVRRWTRKGLRHEIDWALIKINHDRMDARNIVYDKPSLATLSITRRGVRGAPIPPPPREPIHLTDVARLEDLGGLNVHCCGRTSGLQTGQISKAMTIVKLHGRHTFSTSFGVDGNFGVPGDSGAWVFEKSTGRVCGAVLAWSEKSRTAYIAPMEVLLDDIARTLHATHITLPGSPNESAGYAMPYPQAPMPQNPRYAAPLPLPDQLPVDFNRQLRLDDQSASPVNTSRGLRDPYRNLPPILTPGPGRSLERQLA